ncbi:Aste57867_15715 [Aphanomyces stellatus]|uniref:Aste57867_15715 protein n=1 Tax=Aphanomyces stellatus TaxID=120398 RepID=A0A485L420_9STRA|nr:hypothetical protein As57867_015659 [Aphanomyces stellatus]VFT92506.1 Aste57867_15715 [Aphanomyces stellatus]
MQSTASLQHSGENHAALEQIHYYLDGIEDGKGSSRSISALKLAEVCACKTDAATLSSGPAPTNGRLLLRAKGGLTHCIELVEHLKIEKTADAYEHIYCMMTLLYFVTLDTENCESLTATAFSKIVQVLRFAEHGAWRYHHASSTASTPDGDAPKKRALLKKKSSLVRRPSNTRVALVHQAETLLRGDMIFQSTELMPLVTLCDLVLAVLNNSFHTDHTTQYGISQNGGPASKPLTHKSNAIFHERKILLRDGGGLDSVAHIVESASRALETHPGATAQLLHGLRLLDQVSFMERGNQDHLVLHTSILSVIVDVIQHHAAPHASRRSTDMYLMALRVFINLTHKNDIACVNVAAIHGARAVLDVFLQFHAADADEKITFDTCLLTLSALVNCVEHNDTNRDDVASPPTHLDTLAAYFCARVASFQHVLLQPDETATWKPEDVILSGSVAMLLGCLMRARPTNAARILAALPDQSPHLMLRVLVAFVGLHAQIGALSEEILESCIHVETELKRLMDSDDRHATTDIRTSISHLDLASTKPPTSASKSQDALLLSIDATEASFTTPLAASQCVDGGTPPASAFKITSFTSSSAEGSTKSQLRKRTSRVLGVDDSPSIPKKTKKTTAWADEDAKSSPDATGRLVTQKRRKRPEKLSTKSTEPKTSAATETMNQPTFSHKRLAPRTLESGDDLATDTPPASAATKAANIGNDKNEGHQPTFSKRKATRTPSGDMGNATKTPPASSPASSPPASATPASSPRLSSPPASNSSPHSELKPHSSEANEARVKLDDFVRPPPLRTQPTFSKRSLRVRTSSPVESSTLPSASPTPTKSEPDDLSTAATEASSVVSRRPAMRKRPSASPESEQKPPTHPKTSLRRPTTPSPLASHKSALVKKQTPPSSSSNKSRRLTPKSSPKTPSPKVTSKPKKQLLDVFSFDE